MTEPPLAFRIVNWIAIIDQLASTEANRVLRPLGLQLPQFVMLNHFSHRPDEAKTVQQPQPGVTKTVQKLVAKGWLRERSSEGDGRSKLLMLTPAGLAKHRAAVAALSPGLERAFAGWSQDDRRALFALLDRVKVWFDQDRDRAAPQAPRRQS